MAKSKLTPKENYMRAIRGEMPDWVPIHTMGLPGYNGETVWKMVGPSLFGSRITPNEGRTDEWGVRYISNEETNFGGIPEPNNFILDDVTKWDRVIKAPKTPDVDWEQLAKKDYENANIDRTQSAAMAGLGFGPFQQLIAFMGFNNGLCALYEEPEACKELLHWMADFYVPIIERTVQYHKPDMMYLADDTAAKLNPFVSLEMFRDIFMPIYEKLTKPARDAGIPIQYHNC